MSRLPDVRFESRLASLDMKYKYFRQHEHYNREACLDHLSFCFRHNMGAPAFVNRYVNKRPAIAYPGLIELIVRGSADTYMSI